MKTKIYRAWINQPSTLDEYHKYHGLKGIAIEHLQDKDDKYATLILCEGNQPIMRIKRTALSLDDPIYELKI